VLLTKLKGRDARLAYEVQLPPIAEQRRIADILDKADAIRRKRKEAIALTEDLLRSAFLDMFGDILARCSKWPFRPLREFLSAASGKSSKSVLSEIETAIPIYGGNGVNGWATQALYDEPVVVSRIPSNKVPS
jgi:type I restriction enzyme S subunit